MDFALPRRFRPVTFSRCGPLRLSVWPTQKSDRFVLTIYDAKLRRNVLRREIEGTLEEAKRHIVSAAGEYLNTAVHSVIWK